MKKMLMAMAIVAITACASCGVWSKCTVTNAYHSQDDKHNVQVCLKCDSLSAADFKRVEKVAYKK